MMWKVTLYGIKWDDGKGEYDVSELPSHLQVIVQSDDRLEAIEFALEDASDTFGSLIVSTKQIEAVRD